MYDPNDNVEGAVTAMVTASSEDYETLLHIIELASEEGVLMQPVQILRT